MKHLIYLFLMSFAVFTACEKSEMTGAETSGLSILSVDDDGSTDVLVSNLKLAFISGTAELTAAETDGLIWMREEEKMAGDLYTLFYNAYELRIFGNIAQSESTHTKAVLALLNYYNIDDPAFDEAGLFKNDTLQNLFDELKAAGEVSLVEALTVGAFVEETDILDLEEQLTVTTNEDILLVYENLLRGSRNHLRAFVRVLASYGITYEPISLSEDYYLEVIGSDMERGVSGACALGYGYANQNEYNNRYQYNSVACDSVPANNEAQQQNRYGQTD